MKKTLFKVISAIFFIALIFSVIAFATSADEPAADVTCRVTVDGVFHKDYTTSSFEEIQKVYRSTGYNNKTITYTLYADLDYTYVNSNSNPSGSSVGHTYNIDLNGNKLTFSGSNTWQMTGKDYTLNIYSSVSGGTLALGSSAIQPNNTGSIIFGREQDKDADGSKYLTVTASTQIVKGTTSLVDGANVTIKFVNSNVTCGSTGFVRLQAKSGATVTLNMEINDCQALNCKEVIAYNGSTGTFSADSNIKVINSKFTASSRNFFKNDNTYLKTGYLGTVEFEGTTFDGYTINGDVINTQITVGDGCTFANAGSTFSNGTFAASNIVVAEGCVLTVGADGKSATVVAPQPEPDPEPEEPEIPENATCVVTVDGVDTYYTDSDFYTILNNYKDVTGKEILVTLLSSDITSMSDEFKIPAGTTLKIDLNGYNLKLNKKLQVQSDHNVSIYMYSSQAGATLTLSTGFCVQTGKALTFVIGTDDIKAPDKYSHNMAVTNTSDYIAYIYGVSSGKTITIKVFNTDINSTKTYGLIRNRIANDVAIDMEFVGSKLNLASPIIYDYSATAAFNSNSKIVAKDTQFVATSDVDFFGANNFKGVMTFEGCTFTNYTINADLVSSASIEIGAGCTFANADLFAASNVTIAEGCVLAKNEDGSFTVKTPDSSMTAFVKVGDITYGYTTTDYYAILADLNTSAYEGKDITITLAADLSTTAEYTYTTANNITVDLAGYTLTIGHRYNIKAADFGLTIYSSVKAADGKYNLVLKNAIQPAFGGTVVIGSAEYKNYLSVDSSAGYLINMSNAIPKDSKFTAKFLYSTFKSGSNGMIRLCAADSATLDAEFTGCTVNPGHKILVYHSTASGTFTEDSKIAIKDCSFVSSSSGRKFFDNSNFATRYSGTITVENTSFYNYIFNGEVAANAKITVGPGCAFEKYSTTFTDGAFTASNITIPEGYALELDGSTYRIVEAKKDPSGKISYRGYTGDSATRENLAFDIENLCATNSVVIKVYDKNGNLLTTTTLKAGGVEAANYTCNIVLWGDPSSSWNTVIHEELTVTNLPYLAELWCDDVLVDSYENALGAGTNVDQTNNYCALDCVYKAAKIGNTYYMTLAEAFAQVQDGETIILQNNVTIATGISTKTDISFTLDGNGYSIAPASADKLGYQAVYFFGNGTNTYTIKNVTFKDFVRSNTSNGPVLRLENANQINLINVTFDNCDVARSTNTWDSVVRVYATNFEADNITFKNCKAAMMMDIGPSSDSFVGLIVIKNSKFENNTAIGTALIYPTLKNVEGSYLYINNTTFTGNVIGDSNSATAEGRGVIHLGSKAIIENCLFDGNTVYGSHGNNVSYGINCYSGYTLSINNNIFKNSAVYQTSATVGPVAGLAIMSVGTATLEGNTVENNNKFYHRASADVDYAEKPVRSVGTYSNSYGPTIILSGTYYGELASYSGTAFEVKGGTFDYNVPQEFCAPGYKFAENGDGTYGVVVDPAYGKAAQIGNTYYDTFAEAFAAVQAGETLTLLADVTISTKLTINFNLTIDGNGYTIFYTGSDRAIDIPNKAGEKVNVTFTDLTVDCTASYCQRGINYNDDGKLVLNNVTVKGNNVTYALNLPGSSDNCVVEINDSALTGNIALNIWGENSTITATNTVFTSVDRTEVENYSAIALNNDGSTAAIGTVLTINGGKIIALDENGVPATAIRNAVAASVTVSDTTDVAGEIKVPVAIIVYEGYSEFYSSFSLQSAIDKAIETNGKVVLIADITLTEGVVVDGTVTIDLAGYTITYNSTIQGESMITNNGNLTINDSVGTGVIYYNYTGAADPSYSKGNYTISNQGTLTINGGKITIANLRAHAKYPINNNSLGSDATLVINGGHLYNYNTSAIRMICSSAYDNTVIINGGLVEGYCAIWVQNPGKNTTNANLTITGGEIKTTAAAYVNGTASLEEVSSGIYFTTEGGAWSTDSSVSITGGIFNENIEFADENPQNITIGEGATFNGRVELPVYVAEVNGIKYKTLAEALAAAEAGDTITLLAPIVVNKGETLELDLAGKTISVVITEQLTKSYAMITNKGTLTINDSIGGGKISLNYTANSFGYGIGLYTISNEGGTLVINGGRIENLTTVSGSMYDAIDNNSTLGNTYVTINGGEIYCSYLAIRQFANSTTYENLVTVNGGKLEGGNSAIWIQNPGSSQPKADVEINDGNIVGRILPGESTGFDITVSGGTFTVAVPEDYCADGYIPTANTDGTYGVKVGSFVAEVNGTKYETFAEALEAAEAGDTITLLAPIVVNKGETLELNKAVTITYTSNVAGEDMITNKGNLIIDGATLIYVNTDTTATNVTVSTISSEAGSTLTIKSGKVVNNSANNGAIGIYAYAIDLLTNGNLGDVTATITGGEVISTNYMAIRQFNNGTACKNTLTIEGGYIYGAKRAVQIHMDNNAACLTISGGTLEAGGYALVLYPTSATNIAITGGNFTGTVWSGADGIISGGTFDKAVYSGYCADGFMVAENGDGTYGVVVDPAYGKAAQIGNTYYDTFAEAFAAVQAGETLTLLADVTISTKLTINFNLTIDGNGYTIFYTGSDRAIDIPNKAGEKVNVTFTDLTVDCTASYCQRGINYNDDGKLVLNNVTVKGNNVTYALNLPGSSDNCVVEINDSALTGNIALNIWGENSTITATNTVFTSVDRTEVENYSAIALNNDGSTAAIGTVLTINGGKIIALDENGVPATAIRNAVAASVTVSDTTDVAGEIKVPVAIIVYEGYSEFYSSFSLQSAIDKAIETNGKVVLIADITLTEGVVVDGTVTIDLAGYTITYNSTIQGESMITNNGNLTINDSVGTGVIYYNYTGAADPSYSKGNYTISNQGTLTINGGKITIANLRAHAKYPINNNSLGSDATLVINGGHLYNYNTSAIRMICSSAYDNTVIINGGLVEGYCAIWVQNPGKNTTNANLTITGGEIKTTAAAYVNGTASLEEVSSGIYFTTEGGAWSTDSSVSITGGIFNENIEFADENPQNITIGEGATFNGRVELPVYVAEVNGIKYKTFAEALEAAEAGDTINLLAPIVVNAGETLVIDLKGATIVGTPTEAKAYAVITNYGNLTICDSVGGGAIICNYTLAGSTGYAVNTITNLGTLTIEGGKIANNSTSNQIGYAIDNNSGVANAILTINGGEISVSGSAYYDAIRMFCNSTTNENSVTVNGGTVSSIWLQNPSDGAEKNTKDVKGSVTITGGTVNGLYLEPSTNFEASITGGYVGTIANFQSAEGRDLTGFISGGTFGAALSDDYCQEGYIFTANGDGTYGVVLAYSVKIGDQYYENLAAALAAAQSGSTITLLADTTETAVALLGGVTLDLNGYTITTNSFVVFKGNAVVDNGETKGLVAVSKYAFAVLDSSNHMIPVWTGEGYILAEVKDQYQVEAKGEDSFSVTMRPSISGGGITTSEIFKDGALDNGITIKLNIHCHTEGEEEAQVVSVIINEEFIKKAYTNNEAILINIRGAGDIYDHYMVEIEIVSEAGVSDKCVIGVFSNGTYYETVDAYINASNDSSEAV